MIHIDRKTEIVIGHEGEKNAITLAFDVSAYPMGDTYTLEHLRYGDTYAYPISLDVVDGIAYWTPNEVDTAKRGTGRGQLVIRKGDDVVAKSDVFKVINRYSLATTDEVPDGYDSWLDRLESIANGIVLAKDEAVADIEAKKDAVHTELDGYVEAHHEELKGEKGDAYIVTDEDLKAIGDRVEAEYEPQLNELKSEVSARAEATDLATANRKIKALTDVLNGKELAFETNDYNSAKVDVPSGAVADSVLKIGGHSRVSKNLINSFAPSDGKTKVDKGITYTALADGGIQIKGTATANSNFALLRQKYISTGNVSLVCSASNGYSDKITLQNDIYVDGTYKKTISNTQSTSTSYTADGNIVVDSRIRVVSGETVDMILYVQLERGTVATDYEPYFEGIKSASSEKLVAYSANASYLSDAQHNWLEYNRSLWEDSGCFVWYRTELARLFVVTKSSTLNTSKKYDNMIAVFEDGTTSPTSNNSYQSTKEAYKLIYGNGNLYDSGNAMFVEIHINYSMQTIPTNLPILRSAGSVSDERVYGDVKKQYTRIGAVDLGTLESYVYGALTPTDSRKYYAFGTSSVDMRNNRNFLCAEFSPLGWDELASKDGAYNNKPSNQLIVSTTKYSTLDAFKNAMQGVMLYYELAEPIIEDIDPIPQLEAINVEAGGEVSFIDHSDMSFPIPTTHEWVVRNSEV